MLFKLFHQLLDSLPGFQFNPDFNANDTLRSVVNWLTGLLILSGVIAGGLMIWRSVQEENHQQRSQGITVIVISLAIGGLFLLVLNAILAPSGTGV